MAALVNSPFLESTPPKIIDKTGNYSYFGAQHLGYNLIGITHGHRHPQFQVFFVDPDLNNVIRVSFGELISLDIGVGFFQNPSDVSSIIVRAYNNSTDYLTMKLACNGETIEVVGADLRIFEHPIRRQSGRKEYVDFLNIAYDFLSLNKILPQPIWES